jgi:lysophospholipase L1-like esterase
MRSLTWKIIVKKLWLFFGLFSMVVIMLETFCFVWIHIRKEKPNENAFLLTEAYKDTLWREAYFAEFHSACRLQWEPYLYWRCIPFKGNYININDHGLRVTCTVQAKDPSSQHKSLRIFMFGGSTLWGTGARDAYTIPSLFSQYLSQKINVPLDIVNFGESGYVSTQEVILLLRELNRGNIPDVVIFYDGINDVYTAYQNGIAGLPMNEEHRCQEFNLLKDYRRKELYTEALRSFIWHSGIAQVLRKMLPSIMEQPIREIAYSEESFDNLVKETVERYLRNIRLVKALGKEYGFSSFFYWQPVVFSKVTLTPGEKSVAEKYSTLGRFYRSVYSAIRGVDSLARDNHFHNISAIFDQQSGVVYLDYAHITEQGNEIIAARIAQDLCEETNSRRGRAKK